MEEAEFAKVMAALGEVFGKEISESLLEIYSNALSDLTIEQIQEAANRSIISLKFFPKPAELRDFVTGNIDGQGEKAFRLALDTLSKVGRFQSVQFSDQALQVTIQRFGGWPEFAHTMSEGNEKSLDFKKKDFLQIYKNATNCGETSTQKHLPGLFEIHNAANGFPINHMLFEVDSSGAIKALKPAAEVKQISEGINTFEQVKEIVATLDAGPKK